MITSAITIIPSGGCATVGDGSYNSVRHIMKTMHKLQWSF